MISNDFYFYFFICNFFVYTIIRVKTTSTKIVGNTVIFNAQ